MTTQNLYTLQVFLCFSHECKSDLLQCCPKDLIMLLCGCIVNLFRRNLQSLKKHHVTKFQNEVQLLSKIITWKQSRNVPALRKGFQLIKVNTHLVISHSSLYGAFFSHHCFCIQEHEFECSVKYKAGDSEVSNGTKFWVQN